MGAVIAAESGVLPKLRVGALRFGVIFGALSVLPFPLSSLPIIGARFDEPFTVAWAWLDARVGDVLGLDVVRHPSGSGDTLADYVQLAIVIALSLIGATAWTLARPRVLEQPRLAGWARLGLRYYLAATMLGYGLAKVFPGQFGHVVDTNLYAEIGHKSPMGMLWTFMAASRPYQVFGGMMETIGGLFLLWRRTTVLGALVLLPVMTTVVALNFCYDVPVKLYSSLLLVGVIVLLLPDARRLLAAVFARTDDSVVRSRYLRWAGKLAAVVVFFVFTVLQFTMSSDDDDPGAQTSFGVWDVAKFSRDGHEIPAGTDPTRWRVVAVRSSVMLRTADGEDHFYRVTRDDHERLELGDAGSDGSFAVTFHDGQPTLDGTYAGHPVVVELHRVDTDQMPLVSRGFHWIQEYPYNR